MQMKNRLPIIILAVALLISLGGNVYLITKQSGIKNQLTDANNLLTEANNQIADLENRLSDYEDLKNQLADLQDQLSQLSQRGDSNKDAIRGESNITGDNAIPETDEDKALAEQIKKENEAREKGETPQSTEKPQAEVPFPDLPPEIADMFGGPGEIGPGSPEWMGSGANLGEGGTINTDGLIAH